MPDNSELILDRLTKSKSLDGLGLDRSQGRWMIEGLKFEQPRTKDSIGLRSMVFDLVSGQHDLRRVNWSHLHFVKSDLSELSFTGAHIEDCIFEDCRCQGVGLWKSMIIDCAFHSCDLQRVAFGGIDYLRRKTNTYLRTVFEATDMRDSAHSCETYRLCVFDRCRLDSVDFQGAIFEGCVFRGALNETRFRGFNPNCPKFPRNKLSGCNFKEAEIGISDFLNIDLDPSMFPNDPDILYLWHGPLDWTKWLDRMGDRATDGTRLFVKLASETSGTPTMVSRNYLLSIFKEEEVKWLVDIANDSP